MSYLVNIFIISILMSVISIFKDRVWSIVLVSGFWVLHLFSLFQFFHFYYYFKFEVLIPVFIQLLL